MHGTLLYSMIILISAFEYNGGEPAALFPFTTAAEAYSIPGIYSNPLSIKGGNGGTISVYGSRPYSEEALHSYTSGIKYSKDVWGIQFLGHSFGTDFYRENRISAAAGLSPLEMLNTGFSVSAYKLDINAVDEDFSSTMYDAGTGASITPFRWITLACVQNSIFTSLTGKNRYELYPERSAGVLIKPCPGFTLSWNLTDTSAGYINSFAAKITPAAFIHLQGGYTPEDSRFAASLTILLKHLNVSYSISSHPYLGYTHSFGITLSADSEIETIRYSTPSYFTHDKKVNINSAPDEDIKNLPGLSRRSSERIIIYRKKIGPVSEKILRSLGLDNNEILSVKTNCYGLARNVHIKDDDISSKKPGWKRKSFISSRERVKERFRIMIKLGVPASAAIRYSEIPESPLKGDLESALSDDMALTDEQKDAVRRACSK